jgi:cysteine desulfurase
VLEEAREGIGRLLGADMSGRQPDRLIFTSGGTEANNLALFGLPEKNPSPAGRGQGEGAASLPPVFISTIEHPSITGPAAALEARGVRVERLPVSSDGVLRVDRLAALLDEAVAKGTPPQLVSVMLGNNETGVLQPVAEVARLCAAAGVPLHTDAVQAAGKIPVNFRVLGPAAMTISAHKFHGPRGIGALVVRPDVHVEPLLFGGVQQGGVRPGTESVALAVGIHTALRLAHDDLHNRHRHLTSLRDHFESGLKAAWPKVVINGAAASRLPHTSNVSFPGLDRQALLVAFDLAGVCCSTGSACASGSTDPSPVLLAMGLPRDVVNGALRFSFGVTNTAAEIDDAVRRILGVVREMPRPSVDHASR